MLCDMKGKPLYSRISDYVVFDLETTGISVKTDAVIEISAVKVESGRPAGEYTTLVNPERSIPFGATMVNGITDEMVAQSPNFETALDGFLRFAGDVPLVGHNIQSFDLRFLYRDAEKYWGKVPSNDYIDTLPLARRVLAGLPKYTLVELAAHYGLPTDGAHRALNDCRMNQKVYECLAAEIEKQENEAPRCPACGRPMVKRNSRYGLFWGCSGFPECRKTRKI